MQYVSFKKMHLKMSAKCRPLYSDLDILIMQACDFPTIPPNKKTRHNKIVIISEELHCVRKKSTDQISFVSLTILKQLAE